MVVHRVPSCAPRKILAGDAYIAQHSQGPTHPRNGLRICSLKSTAAMSEIRIKYQTEGELPGTIVTSIALSLAPSRRRHAANQLCADIDSGSQSASTTPPAVSPTLRCLLPCTCALSSSATRLYTPTVVSPTHLATMSEVCPHREKWTDSHPPRAGQTCHRQIGLFHSRHPGLP